ncbi:MAG: phosphatase PAP2 family protein [Chthoniobacterales bacterium]
MKRGRGLRLWLPLALLAALVLFGSFYCDGAVEAWMSRHQHAGMTAFMKRVSWWGDWPAHVLAALLGAAVAFACGSRRWMMIFLALVMACAVAGAINRVIKISAGRSRPLVKEDVGFNGPRFTSRYNSFPSGHTAATTAVFATLLLARRRIGLALLPVPLLIAFSRLYLSAHHFSDVVGGFMVGIFAAGVTWHFISTRMLDTRVPRRDGLG